MSSSRGGVTERSLSRVRLYDPARVAQPVVSSFFNARALRSVCVHLYTRARARAFIHRRDGSVRRRVCGRLGTDRTHNI